MDKKYLKGLGLSDEDIDRILAKHQEVVTTKDTAYADLKQKYDLKEEKPDTESKGSDNDLQEKYNALFETNKTLEADNAKTLAALDSYKNKDIVRKVGIHDSFVDFAVFEIGKNLKEGDDFEKAAEKYLETNPKYRVAPGTSSPNLSNGASEDLVTAAARKGAGLPTKED